jgi:hypothetical protein
MRRPRSSRKGNRTGDIQKDLSKEQLAAIGGALAYNEAEVLIDILLSIALGLRRDIAHGLTSRINGVDGKIELAKIALRDIGVPDDAMRLIEQSLGGDGFGEMKQYRDAVIHARVLDAPAGLALSPGKRGKTNEVLLTVQALGGLFECLTLLRLELIEACNIAGEMSAIQHFQKITRGLDTVAPHLAAIGDLSRSKNESEIQAAIVRYREHQKRRLSLPPLPEFPEEPPTPPVIEEPPVSNE